MPDADLVQRVDNLIGRIDGLNAGIHESNEKITASNERIAKSNKEIAALGRYGHRNRWLIAVLAAAVLCFGVLTWQVHSNAAAARKASRAAAAATTEAARANQANASTCQASNDGRALTVQLWDYLFSLSPPPADPSAQAKLAQFKTFVHSTFAQRVCPKP